MIKNRTFTGAHTIFALALLGMASALTAFLVWAAHRGFDLWDEGLYLISSRYPEDVGATFSSYYHYTGLLLSLSGNDITVFRCLGFVSLFVATLLLASGLRAIDSVLSIKAFSSVHVLELVSFLYIGMLVYYACFALTTPSYNLLNTMCLSATTGTTLLAIAASLHGDRKRGSTWMFITGLFIGINLFVKSPSGAIMFAVVTVMATLWPNLIAKVRYQLLASLTFGASTWVLLHFALFDAPAPIFEKYRLQLQYEKALGISIGLSIILRYVKEIASIIWHLLQKSWLAMITLLLLTLGYRMLPRFREKLVLAFCWTATLGVVLVHIAAKYYLGGFSQTDNCRQLMEFYFFWGLALLSIWIVLAAGQRRGEPQGITLPRQDLLLGAMLAAIPFIGAFGTHNFIGYNLLLTLGPWFALLVYLMAQVEAHGLPVRVPIQLAVAGFVASQILTGYSTAQYGAYRGVQEQYHITALGDPPGHLLLDQETHDAIETLKAAAANCDLRRGDRILGFYHVPGLVYALGGRMLVFPFFEESFPTATEAMLRFLPRDEAQRAFVITYSPKALPSPETTELHLFGRKFPEDYGLCGETLWPASGRMIRLWKPSGLAH